MKFLGVLMIASGILGIMFTVRKPPGATTVASGAVGGVASGVA
jgi:hypothetical protein